MCSCSAQVTKGAQLPSLQLPGLSSSVGAGNMVSTGPAKSSKCEISKSLQRPQLREQRATAAQPSMPAKCNDRKSMYKSFEQARRHTCTDGAVQQKITSSTEPNAKDKDRRQNVARQSPRHLSKKSRCGGRGATGRLPSCPPTPPASSAPAPLSVRAFLTCRLQSAQHERAMLAAPCEQQTERNTCGKADMHHVALATRRTQPCISTQSALSLPRPKHMHAVDRQKQQDYKEDRQKSR